MNRKKLNNDNLNDTKLLIEDETMRYVVKRNGIRVSEEVHSVYEEAETELKYWTEIIKRWPDGSKLTIETF